METHTMNEQQDKQPTDAEIAAEGLTDSVEIAAWRAIYSDLMGRYAPIGGAELALLRQLATAVLRGGDRFQRISASLALLQDKHREQERRNNPYGLSEL